MSQTDSRHAALLKARLLARCVELVRHEAVSVEEEAREALADLIADLREDQELWLAQAGIQVREAA